MATRQKTGGRKAGTPNKMTKTVKEMVLAALDDAGGKDYLLTQARDNPSAFLTLLGKVLPTQVTGADDGPIQTEHSLDLSGLDETQLRAIAAIKIDA